MENMKKFNFNHNIKVMLTERGKNIYRKHYDVDPVVDENGFTKFQLWAFMDIYGTYIRDIVLEDGNIYMDESLLEDA